MFSCAVSGTISQADPSFSPFENVQCLANSVVAICLSTKLPDRRFTQSQQIDAVLRAGHDLYRSLRVGTPKKAVFLAADEVPGRIRFSSNQDFAVEKHYIATDLETPQTVNRKNKDTVEKLRRNLERCFAVSHGSIWPAVDNEVDGFIFTAQNKTVGFWKGANNVFHVFDPHAVNQLRLFTLVGGKARVFDCPARGKSLLNCLLADLNMINNVAYEIVRIRVVVGTRIPRPVVGPTVGLFTPPLPPPPPRSIQLPPKTPTASPEKKKFKTCDDQTAAAATSSSLPKTRLPSLIASPTSKRVGGRDGGISEGNDKTDDKTIRSPVSGAKSPTDSKRPADTRKPLSPFAAAARQLFSSVGDEEPVAPKSPDPTQKIIIDDTAMEVEETTTLPPPPSQHDSFESLTSAVGTTTTLPSGESSSGLLSTGSDGDGDGQPETRGKKVGGRPKKRTPKPRLATTQKQIARDAKKRYRDQKRAEIENIVDAADSLSISTPPVVDSSLPAADVASAPPAAPSPPSIPSPDEPREDIISSSDGISSPVVGDDAVIDNVASAGSQRSRGRPKKRGRPKLADKTPQQISAETSKVYRERHPDRVEESRKKHVANHPDAVDRSRKDYAERNPEQVSQSRQIYAQTHPEQVSQSRKIYTQTHPEQVSQSRQIYAQTHPEQVSQSRQTYSQTHPQQVRDSQRAYVASHRDDFLLYQSQYNETRSLPAPLRQFTCLGDREGVDLDEIQPYTLSRPASLADESTYRCRHCNAPFFNEERRRTMWCCGDGDLVLPPLPPIDCPVYDDPYFLNHARAYNNVFCFSALGTSRHVRAPPSGVSLVKIQGKVYHRLFNLDDRRSSAINNTLMWIEDNVERYAVAQNQRLDRQKIRDLEAYLLSVNPFSNRIRQLSKETAEDAHLVFFQQQQQQQRGQIVTGEEGLGGGEPPPAPSVIAAVIRYGAAEPRQAVIWKAGDRSPQVVHFLDPSFEPLQYPLLFPHGSAGWSEGFASTTNKKLTLIKYYRGRYLQCTAATNNKPNCNRFTTLRRLNQEYVVDGVVRMDDSALLFIRRHQDHFLRIGQLREFDETIFGERDITTRGDGAAGAATLPLVGRIFLPSSFTHGPRWMQVQYYNAMAVVYRKGQPTYFVTITCNPRWPEIVNSLNPGETAVDRPDVAVRVFHQKFMHLKRLIKGGKIFGTIDYVMHVIEFQDRGLPHAHLAVRVSGGGPSSSVEIDAFVRATIPSAAEANGRLRSLVLEHMIHNVCGRDNQNAPCMDRVTNKCVQRYPMAANESTFIDDRGYINYKRPCRENVQLSASSMRGNFLRTVNDQYVVPFNPAILLIMACHANVEIATSAKTIRYLMKYVYRAPDQAVVAVVDSGSSARRGVAAVADEIREYQEARVVTASEAYWRILELPNRGSTPAVEALTVHLPNCQIVVYRPSFGRLPPHRRQSSRLLSYLNRPRNVPELQNLTYAQFYEQYIVASQPTNNPERTCYVTGDGHYIYKRQVGECVARLHFISPSLGEVYFLRLLLLNFPADSYESLRTVGDTVFSTFQQAAVARGLVEVENEHVRSMNDAITIFNKSGKRLRQFYFVLISNGAPARILWSQFRLQLMDDFLRAEAEATPPVDVVESAERNALIHLATMLRSHGGRTLTDYGLPDVGDGSTEVSRERARWDPIRCANFVTYWLPLLNPQQSAFADRVLSVTLRRGGDVADVEPRDRLFFLDGPGGTGKTLVLNVIMARLRGEGLIVLPCAFTGIAAMNYPGGMTAHSLFKFPFEIDENSVCNISIQSERADLIRHTTVIVWDEFSTVSRLMLKALDRALKDITQCELPFGGKIIVFAGDFRQIPPIVPSNTPVDVVNASVKSSPFWAELNVFTLSTAQRTAGDELFSRFLLAVGEGRVEPVRVADETLIPLRNIQTVSNLNDLIDFVYPPNDDSIENPDLSRSRTVLSGTNAAIDDINRTVLDRCPGDVIHLYSADRTTSDVDDPRFLPLPEFLHSLTHPGVPDHDLQLKIGSVCTVLRNLSFDCGLVNGTKVIVRNATAAAIE
ncbi:unnamed protein product, partial [Nesidiocoris tenuis]